MVKPPPSVVWLLAAASLAGCSGAGLSGRTAMPWPRSADPICERAMAAGPPTLVLVTGIALDTATLVSSPRWERLGSAPLPRVRLTGFLHVGQSGVELFSTYQRAYMEWAIGGGLVDDLDSLDRSFLLSDDPFWRRLPPGVADRCVVVEGTYTGQMSLSNLTRLFVWAEPRRPIPDLTFLSSEFPDQFPRNLTTAQPAEAF